MKNIIFIMLSMMLILSINSYAAQINGTSYKQNVIVSVGGESANSTSYKTTLAIGIITKIINSTSYINRLGFFHTWLLANDQPCASASQCEGGFCCSSLCKSSSCPSEEESAPGGGGAAAAGGGGGGKIPLPLEPKEEQLRDFSASPSTIKEELTIDFAKSRALTIKNTGNATLRFGLSVSVVSDMVLLSDTSFSLSPGEEKIVEANIIGKRLGSHLGEIEIIADGIKKSIIVVIEVESKQALFDAKMDIPSAYKEVLPGGDLKTQITLLNVGPPKRVDVIITYLIKDKKGNVVHESSETFAVEKQTSFVKSFKIPEYIEPGDYLAVVEVRYENSFAVSSELFRVIEKEAVFGRVLESASPLTLAFVALVGFVLLFAYLLVPRIQLSKVSGLEKYYNASSEAIYALNRKDISKAKGYYTKARKLYIGLNAEERKKVYNKLMKLFNKLKNIGNHKNK